MNRKLEQNEIEAITTQLKEINELHNELLERTPEVNPFTFLKMYNDLKHVIQDYKLELEHSRSTCGILPLTKDHPCFERGHAFYLVCEIDNGRSKYGEHQCSRCGHIEPFQMLIVTGKQIGRAHV